MAKQEQQELTEEARERITRVIRGLADDRVERGVDLSRPMHCDSCSLERSPAGSALYGAYKLCNDCLLNLTIFLASGEVDNVAQFMTTRSDGSPPLPPDLTDQRDRTTSRSALPTRDKLMPSNEPC